MHLHNLRLLRGPNVWARVPVLQLDVELRGGWTWAESSDLFGRFERATAEAMHRLARRLGERLVGVDSRLHAAHCLLGLVLELQQQAGSSVEFGRVHENPTGSAARVIAEYEEITLGRASLRIAQELMLAVLAGRPFDLTASLAELQALAHEMRLGPSTGAIGRAARERGIPVRRLNTDSLVLLGQGARQRRIVAAEVDQTSIVAEALAQDKELTRSLLKTVGVPVPEGRPVGDADDACQAATELGGPVVVKPQYGNHGRGVSTNLTTPAQIRAAYANARKEGHDVVVERYAPGDDYRLLVIGDRLAAGALREPAQVVGNGRATIEQLVAEVNRDPRRSDGHATVLSIIKLDAVALGVLAEQGYTSNSVPAAGHRVWIRRNGNLSTGGTAVDVTDRVHPEVAARAVEAAQVLGLDIAGVDVIAVDIGRPLEEQGGVVVEVNAGPGLRMHLEPSGGSPRPVAEDIISLLFPVGRTGRIPLAAITGGTGTTATARLLAQLVGDALGTLGVASADGTFVGPRCLHTRDSSTVVGALDLLLNPSVEAAIVEANCRGVQEAGFGFDACDVAVVTNGKTADALADDLQRVTRALVESVQPGGTAVVNAEDSLVVGLATGCPAEVVYFSRDEHCAVLTSHRAAGGRCVFIRAGDVVLAAGAGEQRLSDAGTRIHAADPSSTPLQCVLAALSTAWVLGCPAADIAGRLDIVLGERLPMAQPHYAAPSERRPQFAAPAALMEVADP